MAPQHLDITDEASTLRAALLALLMVAPIIYAAVLAKRISQKGKRLNYILTAAALSYGFWFLCLALSVVLYNGYWSVVANFEHWLALFLTTSESTIYQLLLLATCVLAVIGSALIPLRLRRRF